VSDRRWREAPIRRVYVRSTLEEAPIRRAYVRSTLEEAPIRRAYVRSTLEEAPICRAYVRSTLEEAPIRRAYVRSILEHDISPQALRPDIPFAQKRAALRLPEREGYRIKDCKQGNSPQTPATRG